MRVCNCALPYISSRGYKVCETCNNNLEFDSTRFFNWKTYIYPVIENSPVYKCLKCGNVEEKKIKIEYVEEFNWLEIKCLRCGHIWKEDTKDKEDEESKDNE